MRQISLTDGDGLGMLNSIISYIYIIHVDAMLYNITFLFHFSSLYYTKLHFTPLQITSHHLLTRRGEEASR